MFYTWTNNHKGDCATFERLDRVMGNEEWCSRFSRAAVLVLPIRRSDHSPLILDTNGIEIRRTRVKRFEEMWLQCDDVSQITKKVWDMWVEGSMAFRLIQKQKALMRHLCNWSNLSIKSLYRLKDKVLEELHSVQSQLVSSGQEGEGCNSELVAKEQGLRRNYDELL